MTERYRCINGRRRERLISVGLNGIDFLEVSLDQTTLSITFVTSTGLPTLTDAVVITGGVRYPPPEIGGVIVSPADSTTLIITLKPGQLTDYSPYTLSLQTPGGGIPVGFDPESVSVEFSFKIGCPSPFDCADDEADDDQPPDVAPDLNYFARDWSGFRDLMLDRISGLAPQFVDDTAVDHLVTHVEALAYVADHLSYRLDAIANETDMFRARSRVSLRRHARLVDYTVHEGANARVFAQIDYAGIDGAVLTSRTPMTVATTVPGVTISADQFGSIAPFRPVCFETMHDLALFAGNNKLDFHTWSGEGCLLPRGATRATVVKQSAVLARGDFLLLMEIVSPTAKTADADRRKRHVVRLTEVIERLDPVENVIVFDIVWAPSDALPFDLVISAEFSEPGQPAQTVICAESRGNIVLADHGMTLPVSGLTSDSMRQALTPRLSPAVPPDNRPWRPRLIEGPLTHAAPVDLSPATALPATDAIASDPAAALPQLTLRESFRPWSARRDLLSSERFDRHFVVEIENDGSARLRFGDGIMGQAPLAGERLMAAARIGRHTDGSIGADVLRQAVTSLPGIISVTNPLPAQGGVSGVEPVRVRIEAPHAFRVQERAVTEADYAEMAERHPAVASARGQVRWTGSWRTSFVYIDRVGGLPVESDRAFHDELMRHMDRYRLCGIDIALKDAISAPLDMTLSVCVSNNALRSSVRRDLLEQLGSGMFGNAHRAFFHPDNFTFGTPLYVSHVLAAAMSVPGVASAEITGLTRRGRPDMGDLAKGVMKPFGFEVLRLYNDPNYPEHGQLTLDLRGGK